MSTSIEKTGTENKSQTFFQHNLSLVDVILRYAVLMIIVIIGGALGSIPIMLLGMPFFWTAIMGWCPVFYALGINHHTAKNGMS
jgi:hypothetical protein